MSRGRWMAPVVVVVLLVAAGLVSLAATGGRSGTSARTKPLPLPKSMASSGDSITRAFDLDPSHVLVDAPEESWSTGADPAINSQYGRILAAGPAISGQVYNDAQSGAQMVALDGQLQAAAGQGVEYATVLIGANDLCTSTVADMTPTAAFRAQFDHALSHFFSADPAAHVFVASIPDVFRLWETMQASTAAQLVWALAHICQSMLAAGATSAQRQAVVAQEQADNAALASVCAHFDRCRFDGGAVYQSAFAATDVSPVDYFHPSRSGQAKLAAITWAAGYWPTTP